MFRNAVRILIATTATAVILLTMAYVIATENPLGFMDASTPIKNYLHFLGIMLAFVAIMALAIYMWDGLDRDRQKEKEEKE